MGWDGIDSDDNHIVEAGKESLKTLVIALLLARGAASFVTQAGITITTHARTPRQNTLARSLKCLFSTTTSSPSPLYNPPPPPTPAAPAPAAAASSPPTLLNP